MFNANLVNSIRWIVAVYRNRPSNFARGLSGKKRKPDRSIEVHEFRAISLPLVRTENRLDWIVIESWPIATTKLRHCSDRISSRCSLYFCAAQKNSTLLFLLFHFVTDCDSEEIRRDLQYGNAWSIWYDPVWWTRNEKRKTTTYTDTLGIINARNRRSSFTIC